MKKIKKVLFLSLLLVNNYLCSQELSFSEEFLSDVQKHRLYDYKVCSNELWLLTDMGLFEINYKRESIYQYNLNNIVNGKLTGNLYYDSIYNFENDHFDYLFKTGEIILVLPGIKNFPIIKISNRYVKIINGPSETNCKFMDIFFDDKNNNFVVQYTNSHEKPIENYFYNLINDSLYFWFKYIDSTFYLHENYFLWNTSIFYFTHDEKLGLEYVTLYKLNKDSNQIYLRIKNNNNEFSSSEIILSNDTLHILNNRNYYSLSMIDKKLIKYKLDIENYRSSIRPFQMSAGNVYYYSRNKRIGIFNVKEQVTKYIKLDYPKIDKCKYFFDDFILINENTFIIIYRLQDGVNKCKYWIGNIINRN